MFLQKNITRREHPFEKNKEVETKQWKNQILVSRVVYYCSFELRSLQSLQQP